VCGFEVKQGATSCPQCGSDERTGWSQGTYLDGIDLGEDVDYEELRENEFGGSAGKKPKISWVVIVAAVLLLLALVGFLKIFF